MRIYHLYRLYHLYGVYISIMRVYVFMYASCVSTMASIGLSQAIRMCIITMPCSPCMQARIHASIHATKPCIKIQTHNHNLNTQTTSTPQTHDELLLELELELLLLDDELDDELLLDDDELLDDELDELDDDELLQPRKKHSHTPCNISSTPSSWATMSSSQQ